MKILNGISSVSIQSTRYLSNELKRLGHEADIVVYRSNKVLTHFEDRNLRIDVTKKWLYPFYAIKVFLFFIHSLFKYDVFHFHFGHSLLPKNIDLFVLKLIGKKSFMEYHGSDIRRAAVFSRHSQIPEKVGISEHESYLKQRRISRHISGVIVHDSELSENLFDFKVPVFNLPLRLDVDDFIPAFPIKHGDEILILHAPTNQPVKGTSYIISAIQNLKKKYKIDFKLITGLPHAELKKLFNNADIIVDQIVLGTYGMLAIEAMALGKPVVCHLRDDLFDDSDARPPIFSANTINIEKRLEELIVNFELRQRLGRLGRQYVETHHSSKKLAELAVNIYSSSSQK